MRTNEETRLRNLILKEKEGKILSSLDQVYLKKLTEKKNAEMRAMVAASTDRTGDQRERRRDSRAT